MRVSVFGLGYVGTVSAGCLANEGHSPIIEAEIGEIIAESVRTGKLRAVVDAEEAICATDLSFVCVGTPSQSNGNLDLRFIRRICEQIGGALRHKSSKHTVVVRSTVLPGTMRDIVIPILEESSHKKAGVDFGVCHNPEFLREGTAVRDFYAPPKTVVGELDGPSGSLLAQLYEKLDAPLIRTSIEV